MKKSRQINCAFLIVAFLTTMTGCQHAKFFQRPSLVQDNDSPPFTMTEGQIDSLAAKWSEFEGKNQKNTTIVFVPDLLSQDVDHTKGSDGVSNYSNPIKTASLWREGFTKAGYNTLSFEKRSHSKSPTDLAKDLDSACSAVKSRFGRSHKIVLFTSDLGTQIVLGSRCRATANSIAIYSPVPDALDTLWTAGLKEAGFIHKAESLKATLDAISNGLFEANANVMGESLQFWINWVSQSKLSFKGLTELTTPLLFLVGEKDPFVGRHGLQLLEKLTINRNDRRLIRILRADRNLLQKETLSPRTIETTVSAFRDLVK